MGANILSPQTYYNAKLKKLRKSVEKKGHKGGDKKQ